MKKSFVGVLAATAVIILSAACLAIGQSGTAPEVELQLLNPRGEINLPPVTVPAARITDLAGKKIGLYWNGKPGGDHFWNGIEGLLKERLPNTTTVGYRSGFDLGDALAAKIIQETDAFFYGVGD